MAAKLSPTDRQIICLAKAIGIVTGENLRRDDDYLFRSMGTPTNVFGRHLIEFARAVRAFVSAPAPMPCDDCEHPTLCADFPDQHRTASAALSPPPRLLTHAEKVAASAAWNIEQEGFAEAVQRKFCEVNGFTLGDAAAGSAALPPPPPDPFAMPKVAEWPKERRVGRREDMSPTGHLEVMLDGDSDVIVAVTTGSTVDDFAQASVEFCTVGQGGGNSPRTRAALIALMLAIEADNTESPRGAWPPAEGRSAAVPHRESDSIPVSPSGGVWIEWEHLCSQKGEPVLTTKDRRCQFCGLAEADNDDAAGVPESDSIGRTMRMEAVLFSAEAKAAYAAPLPAAAPKENGDA